MTLSPNSLDRLAGGDGANLASAANAIPVTQSVGGAAVAIGNPVPTADQGILQVLQQAVSLGALNAALTCAPQRRGTAVVQVTGTFVGTLQLQGQIDGSTYVAFGATPQFLNLNTGAYTATITGPGVYQTSVNGLVGAKIVMSAYTSGAAIVSVSLTDPPAMIALDAALPAGSNNIGTVNIGNTPAVASTTATGSPAALNATADGVTDLAGYGSIAVQVTGTWVGALTFQVSIDGTNWVSKVLFPVSGGALSATAIANGMFFGPTGARYFRVLMSAYTSGTAVVTMRYNSATIELPIQYTLHMNAGAGDGQPGSAVDEVALGLWNNGSIDRGVNAAGLASQGAFTKPLAVAAGSVPVASLSAAAAPATGTVIDLVTARANHTMQVDIATTAVGTAGSHTVILEGSLDGTYFTSFTGNATPASTSTAATDTSNHAWTTGSAQPFRYLRARWTTIPTGWTGTLTARVISA